MYLEHGQQVWLFTTSKEDYYIIINGIFNIAGCKGYPELAFQGNQNFPDFFPDFKDTWLKSQRYNEQNLIPADELAVRNALSFFALLRHPAQDPGHIQVVVSASVHLDRSGGPALRVSAACRRLESIRSLSSDRRYLKIPLGTLLPYFKEDSKHAYAIVPGFYRTDGSKTTAEADVRAKDRFRRDATHRGHLSRWSANTWRSTRPTPISPPCSRSWLLTRLSEDRRRTSGVWNAVVWRAVQEHVPPPDLRLEKDTLQETASLP